MADVATELAADSIGKVLKNTHLEGTITPFLVCIGLSMATISAGVMSQLAELVLADG
jgi:hypothetical protein